MYPLDEQSIKLTGFADIGHYHPALKRRVLELREDPRFRDYIFHGGCGTKVRGIDRWARLEADPDPRPRNRITLSWNIHTRALPGKPGDYFRR